MVRREGVGEGEGEGGGVCSLLLPPFGLASYSR